MRFAERGTGRRQGENIVPMINVVFLLLIFFLMTASLAPPAPFAVAPPRAGGAPLDTGDVLLAGADGQLAYGTARGDAVFRALADRRDTGLLLLRADAGLAGQALATLLQRLAAAGQDRVTLVVTP